MGKHYKAFKKAVNKGLGELAKFTDPALGESWDAEHPIYDAKTLERVYPWQQATLDAIWGIEGCDIDGEKSFSE